jgi:leucyl aminopeptidase
MDDALWESMKSPVADMKNTGARPGGSITAALFLREYVDTDKVCAQACLGDMCACTLATHDASAAGAAQPCCTGALHAAVAQ